MSGLQASRRFAVPYVLGDLADATGRDSGTSGRPSEGRGEDSLEAGHGVGRHTESVAEQELRDAIVSYQRSSGRMFPTWSEVLEVLQSLGYRKRGEEAVSAEAP